MKTTLIPLGASMTSLRVNADYESVLFSGKPSPTINQVIEFLALFLEQAPLNSTKKYDPAYLDYVATLSGHLPKVVNSKESLNWWGRLDDLERERWWNSKATSQQLNPDSFMLQTEKDATSLDPAIQYLLKDPHGMSGQRIQLYRREEVSTLKWPLLAEPFFDRVADFSHYVFPDGQMIAYENLVDRRFQYKGSVFQALDQPTVENLSFYSQINQSEWKSFALALKQIQAFYAQEQNLVGYSIDSFTYKAGNDIQIRALSEVNYRRTMGRCAYELGLKQSKKGWFGFFILKPGNRALWKMTELRELATVLSPGDTRFEILTISAVHAQAAKEKIALVNTLLANAQTAIDF